MSKRIVFVSPNYYLNTVGGADVQVFMMARGLADQGVYEVFYATPDIEESGIRDNLKLIRMRSSGGQKNPSFVDFERTLDNLDPDLVFQVGRKLFTYYTSKYCTSRGIPFLFRATSDIDCRRLRQFARFFSEHSLRKGANPISVLRQLVMDLRTYRAMKGATKVVAQTWKQQTLLSRLLKKDVALIRNMHHVPEENDIVKDEPPMVLWLASMKAVKRPRLFLEIAKRLVDCDCHVLMAGRMNQERFRAELHKMSGKRNFEYIEHVTFEESNALIARARVFVLTSKREGLPNTLIQSWLRCTPTVSLGVDPDGMIEQHNLGMHVATVGEAVDAVGALISDKTICNDKAVAARHYAVQHFGFETQLRRVSSLIDETLDGT